MRNIARVLGFLGMISIAGVSQQPAPPAQSPPPDAKSVPITPYKPPTAADTDPVQACPAKFEWHPELDGIYSLGKDVKPPRPLTGIDAHLTDEARKAFKPLGGQVTAVSMIGLVVDQQGMPQEICLKKAVGYGLDEEAVKAVRKCRFAPAKMKGAPVAMRITMAVSFRN
jgi:TonB family protein